LAFGLHTNRLTVNRFPRRNLFKVDCRRIVWKEEFPAFMAGLSHDPGEPQTVALEIQKISFGNSWRALRVLVGQELSP